MQSVIAHPRLVPLLIFAACAGALGVAYASEIWGGLRPCVLCYYQRYAFMAAGALGLAGLALGGAVRPRRLLVGLAGLAFLAGAGIAFFHVGVEQHWWRGTADCHAPAFDANLSLEQLRAQLLATDFVACDEIPWSLFGLSIAGYNALASLVLGLASLWAATRMVRESAA